MGKLKINCKSYLVEPTLFDFIKRLIIIRDHIKQQALCYKTTETSLYLHNLIDAEPPDLAYVVKPILV